MKLIKPSFEILEQGETLDDLYKHIELCGRTCYKSTDKITEESAKPFVDRLIKSEHYAMLEHGTVYLYGGNDAWIHLFERYHDNKYSRVKSGFADYEVFVTTNLRVIAENGWWDDLKYLCKPHMFHAKRHTVRFETNIQVYKEYTRHRAMSWAVESTRYCNYLKEKFGASVNFIYPCWLKEDEVEEFSKDLETIEAIYFKWINKGWQAQQAATFLPQATKAKVIMTGFDDDFNHFFDLRARGTTGAPHPQAKELAEPLMNEFINRDYIRCKNISLDSENTESN